MRVRILPTVTREQLRSALDRVLGTSSPERILRELQSSIIRNRAETKPMREVRAVDFKAVGNLFRQLRTAAAKSGSRR